METWKHELFASVFVDVQMIIPTWRHSLTLSLISGFFAFPIEAKSNLVNLHAKILPSVLLSQHLLFFLFFFLCSFFFSL